MHDAAPGWFAGKTEPDKKTRAAGELMQQPPGTLFDCHYSGPEVTSDWDCFNMADDLVGLNVGQCQCENS